MEPDFESTQEAPVARVALRSITSSQVLARPSEWLELLRRYGNVAPFFCLSKTLGDRLPDVAVLHTHLRFWMNQRYCLAPALPHCSE
jgi:hypothetical protein